VAERAFLQIPSLLYLLRCKGNHLDYRRLQTWGAVPPCSVKLVGARANSGRDFAIGRLCTQPLHQSVGGIAKGWAGTSAKQGDSEVSRGAKSQMNKQPP